MRRIATFRDGGYRERCYRFSEVQGINGKHFGFLNLAFYENLKELMRIKTLIKPEYERSLLPCTRLNYLVVSGNTYEHFEHRINNMRTML